MGDLVKHRVVVTGLGIVSPLGVTVSAYAESLFAGRSGVAKITLFDAAELPVQIAAEVKDPVKSDYRDRKINFAIEAARQAIESSGRAEHQMSESAGLSIGLGLEVLDMSDLVQLHSRGEGSLPQGTTSLAVPSDQRTLQQRLTFLQTPSDLCAHILSNQYGFNEPPRVCVSACAAGTDAIGVAFRRIRSGRSRWGLCGGSDSMINPLGVGGFCKLRALSTRNEAPGSASRPFDAGRDGFVLGEGAGMLVLERLDDAIDRDAPIHAEVVGYGSSLDAHGISEPHPEGRGAYQAMASAVADAELSVGDIDAINAHGSSTPKNDVMESKAIKRLLGEKATKVPVISTKSMIGHLISASGTAEAIATIECLKQARLHPTINWNDRDPDCELDYVPNTARDVPLEYMLSNSFGFGGQNASLLLRAWNSRNTETWK